MKTPQLQWYRVADFGSGISRAVEISKRHQWEYRVRGTGLEVRGSGPHVANIAYSTIMYHLGYEMREQREVMN